MKNGETLLTHEWQLDKVTSLWSVPFLLHDFDVNFLLIDFGQDRIKTNMVPRVAAKMEAQI